MFLMEVTAPTSIEVDVSIIYGYFGAFLVLAGVVWGVRHLIKLITRS